MLASGGALQRGKTHAVGVVTSCGTMRADAIGGYTMVGICFAVMFGACSNKGSAPVAGDKAPAHAADVPQRCCCEVDDDEIARKVLIVAEDGLHLEGAMLTMAELEISKLTPGEYVADPERAYDDVQVVVFDDYTPAEVPPVHAIYFHPDEVGSPIPVSGTVERSPRITEIAEGHAVMRGVTMSEVTFGSSRVFAPGSEDVALATSVRDVVIAARSAGGRKIVEVGFSLGDSDLVLRTAFPLLLSNTLDWFADSPRLEQRSVDECERAGGGCVAMASCGSN